VALGWALTPSGHGQRSGQTAAATAPVIRHNPRATVPTTPRTTTAPAPSPTVPTTAAPATTAPPTSTPNPLDAQVASYLSTREGTILATVYDLNTGREWSTGAGSPQPEASVVKLNILEALLQQHPGEGLPAAESSLAQNMIENSDNDAATALWNEVGGADGIRSFDSTIGLTQTTPSPCVVCPGFPWPGWGLSTTSPSDQIALLRQLVEPTSSALVAGERAYALQLMENVTPSERWGVSAGVPSGATVALKNGWLPLNQADTDWQINSVGWVSGLGRNYLIAVLTTGNPSEQYGIDTINGLSTEVWSNLG
jgi:beta-lactamase class A